MSLIYNSLKQHEKQSGSASQADLPRQKKPKSENDTHSLSLVWWGLFGFFLATVVVVFSLQGYWAFQTKEESLGPVNPIGLEDPQLDSAERPEIMVAQNSQVDDSDLKHSIEINPSLTNNKLESTADTDSPLTMNTAKEVESLPDSLDKTTYEPIIERQAVDSQDVNQVQVAPLKVEKQVQPLPIEVLKTAPSQQTTAVLMPLDKPSPVQVKPKNIAVKKEVIKPKLQIVEAKEPNKPVITVKAIPITRVPEAIKASSNAQDVIALKSPHIERNSAEYFMAVKNIVISIKQAVNFKNLKEADMGLNQLKTLSGLESVIYQRMQAYVALKNRNYQEAAMGYKKLLNQKPEDLEANMNLVIVLSELGEKQTAKQQLNRLDNMYPESDQVRQYKKMIKAKYGY